MTLPRHGLYPAERLRPLLHPRSIAVVGASPSPGTLGRRALDNLGGFDGAVHAVNGKYSEIEGRPCVASLDAVPGPLDIVVLAVGQPAVEPLVHAAAARGAGAVVVFASGYAETGTADGRAAQARLAAIAAAARMPVVGPNCAGIATGRGGACAAFAEFPVTAAPGRGAIGLVSQSGAMGIALSQAAHHGVAFSHVLTCGNSCDVDCADFVAALVEDNDCDAIALVFEGLAAPERLRDAALAARARGKPVAVLKLGDSPAGAAAAAHHTATPPGEAGAWRALFAETGMVVAERLETLIETARFLAKLRGIAPAGHGVAVLSGSGGTGILAADRAFAHQVSLPQPGPASAERLSAAIPAFGSPRNPCDATAQVTSNPASMLTAAAAFLDDPAIAALVVPWGKAYDVPLIDELGAAATAHGKPLCMVWMSQWLEGPGAARMEASPHIALFRSMDGCFAALAAWLRGGAGRPAAAGPIVIPLASKDFLSGLMFVLVGGLGLILAWHFPVGTANLMGPGYVPRILCFGIIGIGLLLIGRAALVDPGELIGRIRPRPLALVLGAILLFATVLERLGLVVGAVGLVLLASVAGDDLRWKEAAVAAVLLTLFAAAVFVWGLGLPIPDLAAAMSDFLGHLALGLSVAVTPVNLGFCFIGALLGTLIGVLPGIGPLATVAMLMPITFYVEPTTALVMLAGIYYGAQYGGSTTSILVNLPGESSSVVTCIDGYQMAKQGRAGSALAVAALGSFFAGCVATLVIALFSPPLTRLAQLFQPADYCALMVFGLVAAVVLANGSPLKAVGMVLVGLLLGLVGTDINSGYMRFTMGNPHLVEGIGFVPLAMGLFGIAEIITNLERPDSRSVMARIERLWPTRDDFRRSWKPALRGTAIGTLLGVLPGGGALLSSFSAYTLEKKIARDPSRFGRGAIEGVAAPESANNAGAQTSFIPLLTLGIPGNALIAMMAGAMMIHGIAPGPLVIRNQPELFWGLIASMWVGNLMLVIINLPLIGVWVSLLKVPYRLLFPAILLFCSIGAYGVGNATFDVFLVALFGLAGYIFIKIGCEPAPLLLGFILGPLMEENLRRSLLLSRGSWTVFVERPISLAFLLIAALLVVVIILPSVRQTREEAFREE